MIFYCLSILLFLFYFKSDDVLSSVVLFLKTSVASWQLVSGHTAIIEVGIELFDTLVKQTNFPRNLFPRKQPITTLFSMIYAPWLLQTCKWTDCFACAEQ
mgnify:FL=1